MRKNKKFYLTIGFSAALGLALTGGWWSVLNLVKDKYLALEKTRDYLSIAIQRQDRIRLLEKKIRDLEEGNREISDIFVNEKELVKIIESLESIASKTATSIKMEGINFSPEDNNPGFQFSVSGEFSGVFQYLALLENIPYEIVFDEVRLKKISNETAAPKTKESSWQGKFKIKILSYLVS